jgi:small basic protein
MATDRPAAEPDAGSASKLQVLATEHWSLLATRALTTTESLGRVTIFLAILSGAVITLALVAQADQFGKAFTSIAIVVLGVVLFAGLATISRLNALNRDDYRWVVGMNRLRNAYLEMHPDLEPHFITSGFDDLPGALRTLGIDDMTAGSRVGSILHLLQTLPGMLTVIVAAVGGGIGALVAHLVDAQASIIVAAAAVAFLLVLLAMRERSRRSVMHVAPALEPRFPSPSSRP